MKEKVIFRKEYDPFKKEWGYLAIFPEDEAGFGMVCALPFKLSYGMIIAEPYTEICYEYMLRKKIIHKKDPIAKELLSAIQKYYGTEFEIIEKITKA